MKLKNTDSLELPVSSLQRTRLIQPPSDQVPSKKIIRQMGLKVTNQRIGILDVIRNGPSHFTAQDIFENVAPHYPDIGFATVYRFLRTLTQHNYVTEVRLGGMPARYEWAEKRHHDHLTCLECSSIVEFENLEIERLQDKVAHEYGFDLKHHVLELYGICASCRAKKSTGPQNTPDGSI